MPLNSLVAILHWRAVLLLVSMLSHKDQASFREMYSPPVEARDEPSRAREEPPSTVEEPPALRSAFDSHYHHDRAFP
jgi:hypothetical protein